MRSQRSSFNFKHDEALSDEQLRGVCPVVFEGGNAGRCSREYVHVQTSAVVSGLREAGWLPVFAQQKRTRVPERCGFQKHEIWFRRHEDMCSLKEHNVELTLTNAHDAGSAYVLRAGVYRRICMNGLVVSDGGFEAVRFRHLGLDAGDVVDASLRIVEGMPVIEDKITEMSAKTLSDKQRLEFARRAVCLRWDGVDGVEVMSPEQVLVPRRTEDAGMSLWNVVNVVQENLVAGGASVTSRTWSGAVRTRRVRALTSIDARARVNLGIWSIAEAMLAGVYGN